jgi:hypothetical protein
MNLATIRKYTTGIGAAALLTTVAGPVEVASASANPAFNSTYDFDSNLYGSHTFTVGGDGKVTVTLQGTYGPAEKVDITVEIQTCGFFGCNWDGATVGGDCVRDLYVGGTATCNFVTGNSNNLHRIDMSKGTYGTYIQGNVSVK